MSMDIMLAMVIAVGFGLFAGTLFWADVHTRARE